LEFSIKSALISLPTRPLRVLESWTDRNTSSYHFVILLKVVRTLTKQQVNLYFCKLYIWQTQYKLLDSLAPTT